MNSQEMSKYMNQLYNRNKNLQSKVKLQKTSSSSKPVDSCNNEFKEEGKFNIILIL